ncbi:hypothetical protein STEG23_023952 [Scotinomys teguina]
MVSFYSVPERLKWEHEFEASLAYTFPTERGHRVSSGTERASPLPPAVLPAVPAVRTAATPAPLRVRDYRAEPGDRIANELRSRPCSAPP